MLHLSAGNIDLALPIGDHSVSSDINASHFNNQLTNEPQSTRSRIIVTTYPKGPSSPRRLPGGGDPQDSLQLAPDGRPFAGDDGVGGGVADGAVGHDLVAAQDAVEFRAKPLDGAAGLAVEPVGAELDSDAAEGLEGVGEQQQLRC